MTVLLQASDGVGRGECKEEVELQKEMNLRSFDER